MTTVPVGQILTNLATEAPDATAIVCGGRSITRREFESRANRLARAYASRGVTHGSIVAVALPNGIEFYEACFAAWKLGATPLPISWRLPAREREAILDLAQPALVVGAESGSRHPFVPAGFEPPADLSDAAVTAEAPPVWKVSTSGGSTGRPKLIVAGSSGDIDAPTAAGGMLLRPHQTQLVAGPLYHTSPFTYSMLGACIGQTLVVMPRFDAETALRTIEEHRVQFLVLVPTMMQRMLRVIEGSPRRYDLSSVETLWHLAAPCPAWLKEAWIRLIGAEKVFELYGGTELQAVTVISGAEWLTRRGSVGRPIRGEIKVFGPDGVEAPPGTIGEIYMRRSAGTPETYRYIGSEVRSLDGGWESLGDMGHVDEEGFLYLSDRRSDMILVGGANIYPAEVEAALSRHPRVLSSVVVGIPDDDLGQRLHAVVEVDGALDEDELRRFLLDEIEPHKAPRSIRFVSESLRDDAGKVRRSAVREQEIALLAADPHGA